MVIIKELSGEEYDLDQAEIRTRDVIISSPEPVHNFVEIEGKLGISDMGSSIGPRSIEALFRATSKDTPGFSLLRDKIFRLFNSTRQFYFIEKREPGKRWLAKVASSFTLPQRNVYGNFDVPLIGLKGVAESIGTTQDIHHDGINSDAALWGFGMGLIAEEGSTDYIHTGSTFRIFNAGDVEVHPFESYLRIVIDQVTGSTVGFRLSNVTTGDVFRYVEPLTGTLVIEKDVRRNDAAALGKTNRQFITLAPGWNEFVVEGATSARVSFDFRFLYQ